MDSDTVLELRMKEECYLKNVQEALSGPFSTAYFDFTSTGLVLKATDTSGGAFAVLQLSPEAFDHYSCHHQHFSMALELAAFAKIFSFANDKDDIIINYKYEDAWNFPVSLQSPDSHVIIHFVLDIELKPRGVPEFPESLYQAIVCMPSAKFKRICDKLSCDTGDRKAVISISVDKDNVCFFADEMTAKVRLQTQNGDKPNEATSIRPKEKISLTFGRRHLKNFSKASTLSDQVTIKLSSDLLVVDYKITGMGNIKYHVMPADKESKMEGIEDEDMMQNDD